MRREGLRMGDFEEILEDAETKEGVLLSAFTRLSLPSSASVRAPYRDIKISGC